MTPLRKRMTEELQLRNLSATTVLTYVRSVERFAKYFRQSPEMLGAEHVRDYPLHLKNDRKVQTNTILVNRSALRFLYVNTLKQTWFDDQVPMPKRRPGLPGQLSAEEITGILDHTTNLKHLDYHRDLLRYCPSLRRASKPEGRRHRQQADGDFCEAGQRWCPSGIGRD